MIYLMNPDSWTVLANPPLAFLGSHYVNSLSVEIVAVRLHQVLETVTLADIFCMHTLACLV